MTGRALTHGSNRMRAGQAGVSLIELMVALVIGSLLIIGAVTVYMQSRTTYRTSDAAARMQEVGRYALDLLESDARLAGFWGLTNRPDFVENRGRYTDPMRQAVDPLAASNCGMNFVVNTEMAIEGRDAAITGGTGYDLTCAPTTNAVNWSDVLIVRRASSDIVPFQNGRTQIQSSRMRALIFDGGAMPPMFDAATSETRNMIVHAYYVSEVLPVPADGVRQFRLMRKTLIGGPPRMVEEEVIPGIEDMQIQFGIDNAPRDGNVERYVNPNAVPLGARVASVRIWLRVIADEREVGFNNNTNWNYANANFGVLGDDRRRVLVSKTIQIRNAPI